MNKTIIMKLEIFCEITLFLLCSASFENNIVLSASDTDSQHFEVAFQWNYLNFTWQSPEQMQSFGYVPGEDLIVGIKIYKDIVYLALPRIKKSARVTLASIPIGDTMKRKEDPLLSPYPNWEMNSGSSCDAFQYVFSMEIDKEGIMWVLDANRSGNKTDCPPRIVLLDLNDGGKIVENFVVPDDLCSLSKGCFLNDIVVDGDYAYISDTTATDPGIFIYHRASNTAWKARDKTTMYGDPAASRFTAQGVERTGLSHINGIALSPSCSENRTFYYMPQTSFHIYSVSNRVLQNQSLATADNFHDNVKDEGVKQAQSGGMICDTNGDIYYGLLPLDSVGKWNIGEPLSKARIVETNHEIIRWPDSFAIYEGYLYLITNSILRFSVLGIDKNEVNFRIIKLLTNTRSYIYC